MLPLSIVGTRLALIVLAVTAVPASGLPNRAVARPSAEKIAPTSSVTRVRYRSPVLPLRVLRPFQAPRTRYGPGHRGVDLATSTGIDVHPAGAGVVTFAGAVAGRGVVVVAHGDGIRTEYEPLTVRVHRGDAVTPLSVLGVVSGHHGACTACLHWGARRAADYFDPLSLLSDLGPVRLVPWTDV